MGKTNKNKQTNKKAKTKKIHILANKTPKDIYQLSLRIQNNMDKNKKLDVSSYSPSINQELVSLKSVEREPVFDCNNTRAYQLKEPLKIGIKSKSSNKIKCLEFDNKDVIKQELKALQANKHIDPDIIVPPVQHMSNCWFNTMFMSFFVSDKGRKFFHYFRQLMIEGRQHDGTIIPKKLRNAYALLNYAIDATLYGHEFALRLDTNAVIKTIYDSIPKKFKKIAPYIVDINTASNPIRYYIGMADYLDHNPLQFLIPEAYDNQWPKQLSTFVKNMKNMPDIMVLEIFDGNEPGDVGNAGKVTNKKEKFTINGTKYVLDSCIIRDINRQHFCCLLTCEGKEYAYDGFSYKRLVKMDWKDKLNKDYSWQFEGTNNLDGSPMNWNFMKGYQMLYYYRDN